MAPMADLFERLGHAGEDGEQHVAEQYPDESNDGEFFDYLSSHPSDGERIEALRAADVR